MFVDKALVKFLIDIDRTIKSFEFIYFYLTTEDEAKVLQYFSNGRHNWIFFAEVVKIMNYSDGNY